MHIAEIASAFAGGLLAFFTPCVFPLLPGYISMISGVSANEAKTGGEKAAHKAGRAALLFVAGFAAVFSALGASASALAGFLTDNTRLLTTVAGAALIFFGLHAIGLFNIGFFQYEKRFALSRFKPKHAGAFLMGAAFALGWSPCIGPILAGFLAMAAAQGTAFKGFLLLFVFSLGLGAPFIVAAFAVGKLFTLMSKYRRFVRYTEVVAGMLLTLIGLALILSARTTLLNGLLPV